MAFGFGVLRRSSAEFWAMTPRELASASNANFLKAGGSPARADMAAMMQKFPDSAEPMT